MKFIYIASPYTKGDVAINVRDSIGAADALALAGYAPFCPLLTHFWHLVHPHPVGFWYAQDMLWLERCEALIRLPGESSGADAEVLKARQLGLPVYFGLAEFWRATDPTAAARPDTSQPWTCQKCGQLNSAGSLTCGRCEDQ